MPRAAVVRAAIMVRMVGSARGTRTPSEPGDADFEADGGQAVGASRPTRPNRVVPRRSPRNGVRWTAELLTVAVLVMIAAALRYRQLSPSSLYLDDAWAALGYKAHGVRQLARTVFPDPLFALSTAGWLKAAGLSSFKAQLLPFTAGIVCPAAVYLVGRSMKLGTGAALLASALIAISPYHMIFSTRVKQYTLEALLATLMIGVAWWLLDAPSAYRWRVLTATSIAVTVAGLAVAPVVAGAYGAALLSIRRHPELARRAVASVAAYGVVALTIFVVVVKPRSHEELKRYWRSLGGFWTTPTHGSAPLAGLFRALGHLARGFSGLDQSIVLVVLAVAIVGAFVRSLERAVVLVTPLAVAIVMSGLHIAPLGGRVDVYLYPSLALLIAYAVEPLFVRLRISELAARAVALAALLVLMAFTAAPGAYLKEDIRPLVVTLETQAHPADPVILYSSARYAFALYTSWPTNIVGNSVASVPFDGVVTRPGLYLSDHRPTPSWLAEKRASPAVQRIWFIGSHGSPKRIASTERVLEEAGFTRKFKRGDASAWLEEFVRADG